MEQNESIFKSSVKNREVNVNLVRILSARVRLVCIQHFSTLRRARNNFFTATCFTFEIASKIENCGSKKRVLPKARCLGGVADRKLGSRMDAPIFDFGRATIPELVSFGKPLTENRLKPVPL